MHPTLRLVGWASYILFVGSAAVALLIMLSMIWSESAGPARWKALGTSMCALAFALLMLVGTKALHDAVGTRDARTHGGGLAR